MVLLAAVTTGHTAPTTLSTVMAGTSPLDLWTENLNGFDQKGVEFIKPER